MKILNTQIENFMVIEKGEIKLDDRGLILIQGENESDPSALSNGSGKSTLVNAICWCLYGQTANGDKGDDVLSSTFPKNCMVRTTIEDDDGEVYYVIRYRNHKECKNRLRVLTKDGGDLTKGTDKLTQEFVERLVGASIDVFLACIYASQENIPNLPALTDKELKTIIEESAGINRLTMAYDIARSNALSISTKYDNATNAVKLKQNAIEDTKNNISDAKDEKKNWDREQSAKIENLSVEISSVEVEVTDLSISTGFKTESDCIVFYDNKIKEVQDNITKLSASDSDITSLEDKIKTMTTNLTELVTEKDFLFSLATKEKSLAETAKDKIGEPCSTCGKPYCSEDLETIINNHMEKVSEYKITLTELINKISGLRKEIEVQKTELEALKEEKPDVSKFVEQINKLNTQKNAHLKNFSSLNISNARLDDLKKQLSELRAQANPFLALIDKNKETLEVQKRELADLTDLQNELADKVNIHNLAKTVFSPSGVRNHILTNVTPFLNARTADYLNTLSDGTISAVWSTTEMTKKGEVKDKFNIVVSKKDKAKSFSLLSGGEKRKVRIATALAVQDLVANRATKDIKLFIGDEIDDALDTAGLERLMGILETKAREKGTVMIISHKEMKSWFRESILVKLNGDRSVVIDPAIEK